MLLLLVNAALVPLPLTESFPQSHHQHYHDDDDHDDDDNCDQLRSQPHTTNKYLQVDHLLATGGSNADAEVIKFVANMAREFPSVH